MGKRLWGAILFVVAAALGAQAQYFAVNGACTLGGQATMTQGIASSGTKPLRGGTTLNGTGVMASYPGCTVTVFQTGTNTLAQIFSTASGGAVSNPFTANLTDGTWVFFASGACYDVTISSGATQASTMPNSKTFPGVCAGAGGSGGGGGGTAGTSVTVNGTAAVPNSLNFTNTLLVPGGSSVVNFLLNGNTVGAYVTGGGGGGGGTLPTTPQYDLFASSGAGAAQVSGVKGGAGFLQGQVLTSTGDVNSNPSPFPSLPNASVEYFPQGAVFGGLTVGATNGLAAYFSHSGSTGAAPGYHNGGIMLGGGNSSGTNYQVYVDCESSPSLGCDFKVPITLNGSAIGGGGGGGGLPTIPQWNLFASSGVGTATDSGVAAETGFLRAQVLEASGAAGAAPSGFTPPNGSIEYFPNGATYGGLNVGSLNGIAIHFSHSSKVTGAPGNGGVALAGGNATGTASTYQIYMDCEQVGCDFKVPITYLGNGVSGGTVNWGSIAGTLSNQTDLQTALNGKLSTTGTAASATALAGTPTLCTAGQAAAGILANGNATGCITVPTAPPPNQTVTFTSAQSATLTSTTTALVWACWDGSTPANAIYPSNVSVNPSTFLVTFNFTVQQTGTCVVNSSGGGGGGGGGTITGVTPSQGLAVSGTTIGLQSCPANQMLQSAGTTWGCIATPGGGGGGSGTVNSGTAGFYGFYAATGTAISGNTHLDDGATTTGTITAQETIAAPGINVTGSGGIAMTGAGGTLPTPAAGQGGIGIGPGNVPQFYSNGGVWTAIGSGGGPTIYTCTISADTSFTSTQATICSQALGATARQWRVHCSIPWNFTGGSGSSNVVIGINLSATPSYQTYLSPVMWATTGPSNMGAVAVNASGNTALVTANGLTAGTGGTIFTVNIDGTVAAAANTTIYIYGTASVGTAAFRPGVTCELI